MTKVQAIILMRKNIGEADRLLFAFTRERGLILIKARGVRKITSKLAPHIEPMQIVDLTIVEGKRDWVLTGFQPLLCTVD